VAAADDKPTLQILYRLLRSRFVGLAPHRSDRKVPREAAGTQKMPDLKQDAPPSVEFRHALPVRKSEDDTHEIVSKKAQQYLAHDGRLTVSRLILVGADGSETSFALIRDSYTLGRHKNNDIVVTDPKVSSFHGRIDRNPDGFHIVDLKSRNGCWVNGKRMEAALLKTGDEIRVGAARLVYKVDYTSAAGVS
jgi:pSer/pThr/pTyr-binding forkhead associated (FHA) protein